MVTLTHHCLAATSGRSWNIVHGEYGRALSRARGNHYQVSCRRQVVDTHSSQELWWPFAPLMLTITVCTQCFTSIVLSFLDSFIQRQCGQPFFCVIWDTLGQVISGHTLKTNTLTNPSHKVEVFNGFGSGSLINAHIFWEGNPFSKNLY